MQTHDIIYTEQVTITAAEASAGKTVETGRIPRYVKLFNQTQGIIIEWVDSMSDADYFQTTDTDTDTDAGSTPDADGVKFVTTGGITKVSGDRDTKQGFSIDAGLLTEDDVIDILAF